MTNIGKRLTWEQIVEQYPDKWVGLVDIEWEDESNIKSAIVKYSDKSKSELLKMSFNNEIEYSCYTKPDNVFQLGMIEAANSVSKQLKYDNVSKLNINDIKPGMRVRSSQLADILDTYIVLTDVKLVKNKIGVGTFEGTISSISKTPLRVTKDKSVLVYHDSYEGEEYCEYE